MRVSYLVRWCSQPSQPLGVTSGHASKYKIDKSTKDTRPLLSIVVSRHHQAQIKTATCNRGCVSQSSINSGWHKNRPVFIENPVADYPSKVTCPRRNLHFCINSTTPLGERVSVSVCSVSAKACVCVQCVCIGMCMSCVCFVQSVCSCLCMFVCVSQKLWACIHECVHKHVECVCVCVYVCVRVHVSVHVQVFAYR